MQGNPTGPIQISPTQEFVVKLELQQWNTVLQGMAEAPFKLVAPLVQAISEQINEQGKALGEGQGLGNGQDFKAPLSPPN
jgi:hypothetical protein